jgi:prevent-host-death family protein
MPKILTVSEARAHLGKALLEVEAGGEVVITRRGKPIATIVPVGYPAEMTETRKLDPSRGLASNAGGAEAPEEVARRIAETGRRSLRGVLACATQRHIPPEQWEEARQEAWASAVRQDKHRRSTRSPKRSE